jgi:hypothetical protein
MKPDEGQTYWQADQDDQSLFVDEDAQTDSAQAVLPSEPITWTASEYVQSDKHVLWYLALIGITILLLGLAVFMQAWTFAVLVVVLGIGVGVLAGRPPHSVKYVLSDYGLRIDEKTFAYHDFRAFGVVQDAALYSIVLIPNKRFMPTVNVYFPTEMGEQIVDIFGSLLPMEHVEPDIVDRIARKLRF